MSKKAGSYQLSLYHKSDQMVCTFVSLDAVRDMAKNEGN